VEGLGFGVWEGWVICGRDGEERATVVVWEKVGR